MDKHDYEGLRMPSADYTEKKHALSLLMMLETKNPCSCCPACDFGGFRGFDVVCDVCRKFIEMEIIFINPCPCNFYGPQEAMKRTWLALEEKGYI